MGTKELKSLGGTTAMIIAIVGVGFFARSATAEQTTQVEQPPVAATATLGKISPRDIPKSVIEDGTTAEDSTDETDQTQQLDTSDENTTETTSSDNPENIGPVEDEDPTKPTTVSFRTISAEQSGDVVLVIVKAKNQGLDGVCSYTFTFGTTVVQDENEAAQANCSVSIPVSAFSESGLWSLVHTYSSNDSLVSGSSDHTIAIALDEPEPELSFVKTSAEQDEDSVQAVAWLSDPGSGVCTFTFTHTATEEVVTATRTIVDSRICTSAIPLANFPASGNYSVTALFESESNQTVVSDLFGITLSL